MRYVKWALIYLATDHAFSYLVRIRTAEEVAKYAQAFTQSFNETLAK